MGGGGGGGGGGDGEVWCLVIKKYVWDFWCKAR